MNIGIVGTSWWVDSMYLPALEGTEAAVVSICGRDRKTAEDLAGAWNIPGVFTDPDLMIAEGDISGVIVASANPSHHPVAKAALQAGLHVLCEKPLANSFAEASELAALARDTGLITMVPFTYLYMPAFRYLVELVNGGYVGVVHHINIRYHSGYGIDAKDQWKFDSVANPAGVLADLGTHMLALVLGLGLKVDAVSAAVDVVSEGSSGVFDGRSGDSSIVVMRFEGGAHGVLHASAVAYEGTEMNQRHAVEVHGRDGTVSLEVDWDNVQRVSGARRGSGPVQPLEIPDRTWGDVRRAPVHDTYRDVFRSTDVMAREWVEAIASQRHTRPDFADGAAIQRIVDAAMLASRERRWVDVADIRP